MHPTPRALLPLLLFVALGACATAETDTGDRADSDGWISLFDGQSLDGWTPKIRGHAVGDNFADTFRVADGVIQVGYEGYDDGFQGRFGHLFHDTPYSHYILQLEYRFTGEQCPGGPGWAFRNSGVMFHGQTPGSMAVDQDFPVSIEVQLLGGDGEHPRATGNVCTPGTNVVIGGELIRRHCTSSTSPTFHGDGWVRCEIEVHGSGEIVHRIAGEEVLRYREPQLDENDADAQALIVERGGLLLGGGTISLQSESHPCEFRRIRIKRLDG